jgi:dihydropyrimidinase
MFGLYPKKGAVAVGSDADLVVYDPAAKHTISASSHHMNVDYSCYEGREVTGEASMVLSRGKTIIEDGAYVGAKGDGRFLRREPSQAYLKVA